MYNHSFINFEIIIIDDGSSDNGVELIKFYFNDLRINIIQQDNCGVSAARNRGIFEAKNDWIVFLDADDEWLPDYLKYVYLTISQIKDVGMIFTGRYSQNILTQLKVENVPKKYKGKIEIIDFFQNPHVFAHISATAVKRIMIQEYVNSWGGFVPGHKSNEDFLFLFRVAFHLKTAYCGFPLSVYNGGVIGQATSTLSAENKLKDSILFHNLVIKEWIETKMKSKSFKIFIKYEIRHIIYNFIKINDYRKVVEFIYYLNKDYNKLIFNSIELKFYKIPIFKMPMILFIIVTKIKWRLNCYPRVYD